MNQRYVNDTLEIQRGYLIRKRLTWLAGTIIFILIVGLGLFYGRKLTEPKFINSAGEKVPLTTMPTELKPSDEIVFSNFGEISSVDKILSILGVKEQSLAEVIVLPLGINPETGLQLKNNEYFVGCLSDDCKGQFKVIDKSSILGVLGE